MFICFSYEDIWTHEDLTSPIGETDVCSMSDDDLQAVQSTSGHAQVKPVRTNTENTTHSNDGSKTLTAFTRKEK